MSDQPSQKKKFFRRRRYLIDWKPQLGVVFQIVGVLCGVCVIYALGVTFLMRNEALFEVGADRFRQALLEVNAVYLAVSAGIFSLLAIGLTHRFVGPAFAMRRAVEAMKKGDYSARLTLRRRDYLKELAASLSDLREQMRERDQVVADLERCLQENDIAAAKELVTRLKQPPVEEPEATDGKAEDADGTEKADAPAETEAAAT
ncbi:MAG: hypothetical protein ACYTEZ_00945 [Planctomycetota bacterium]|jgi:methyl-accepting chemotaxis protein